jgi:hypothetical protein
MNIIPNDTAAAGQNNPAQNPILNEVGIFNNLARPLKDLLPTESISSLIGIYLIHNLHSPMNSYHSTS